MNVILKNTIMVVKKVNCDWSEPLIIHIKTAVDTLNIFCIIKERL